MDRKNNCLLCGAELVYFDEPRELECAVCHKTFTANAACKNGHYICDRCHLREGAAVAVEYCRRTDSRNPVTIMQKLMREPCIHMHGPEHHVLVGAALLAACRNSGADVDLDRALREMERRGKQVPGGACGFWGCCGAAVSAGIAVSILSGATPLKGGEWGLSNAMTAAALGEIASYGGPRCCKRDSFTAVRAAVPFIRAHFGWALELPARVVCGFSSFNEECLHERCPYNPSHRTEKTADGV